MNFVYVQTILSRRHSGKRKFFQNKGFPTVKGFTIDKHLLSMRHLMAKINIVFDSNAFIARNTKQQLISLSLTDSTITASLILNIY